MIPLVFVEVITPIEKLPYTFHSLISSVINIYTTREGGVGHLWSFFFLAFNYGPMNVTHLFMRPMQMGSHTHKATSKEKRLRQYLWPWAEFSKRWRKTYKNKQTLKALFLLNNWICKCVFGEAVFQIQVQSVVIKVQIYVHNSIAWLQPTNLWAGPAQNKPLA